MTEKVMAWRGLTHLGRRRAGVLGRPAEAVLRALQRHVGVLGRVLGQHLAIDHCCHFL